MSWVAVRDKLSKHLSDFSGEVAFRASARTIALPAYILAPTRQSKETHTAALMASLRGLLTCRVLLDGFDRDINAAVQRTVASARVYSGEYSTVVRAVRNALSASLPLGRDEKMEAVRAALQAARDLAENATAVTSRRAQNSSYFDIWSLALSDIEQLEKKAQLTPPIDIPYLRSPMWQKLERGLLGFDSSWRIWIIWMRYRLFGVVSEDIPLQVWPRVERRLALQDNDFWSQSELSINAAMSRFVVEGVEEVLNEEVSRSQSSYGVTFFEVEPGRFEVADSRRQESDKIKSQIAKEVLVNASALLAECRSNSASSLKGQVIGYLEVLGDGAWSDDALLVMRGDALRYSLASQESRTDDSDIPPIGESALQLLGQTVRTHNMLVNSHQALLQADRMLQGPDAGPSGDVAELKVLIESAESRDIVTKRARAVLEDTHEALSGHVAGPRQKLRALLTGDNFLRAAIAALWHRRVSIVTSAGTTVGTVYVLGHWLLANQTWALNYFSANSTMTIIITKLIALLSGLPLS